MPASGACVDQELSPTPETSSSSAAPPSASSTANGSTAASSPLRPNAVSARPPRNTPKAWPSATTSTTSAPRPDPARADAGSGYIYDSQIGYEVGENIAWGTLWLSTPRAIVAAWMASPGHRANILDAHYRDTGIGVSPHPPTSLAPGQAGAIYTQDFGVIVTG